MQGPEIDLPQNSSLYDLLKTINGLKFTAREVDVIAFLLSGRGSKTIAHYLSIKERTVETHKYNIMRKLECNSKESIINFIEKVGISSHFKAHYHWLLIQNTFEQKLKKIKPLLDKTSLSCLFIYWDEEKDKTHLIYQIKDHLECSDIKIIIQERQQVITCLTEKLGSSPISHVICFLSNSLMNQFLIGESKNEVEFSKFTREISKYAKNVVFALVDKENPTHVPKEYGEILHIDFKEEKGYYSSFFKILYWLFPFKNIEEICNEFSDEVGKILNTSEIYLERTIPKFLTYPELQEKNIFRVLLREKIKPIFWGIGTVSVCSLILLTWDKTSQSHLNDMHSSSKISSNYSVSGIDLSQLTKEFNDVKIKSKNIINTFSFEMINDTFLWTNKKYSISNLEKNNLIFKEILGELADLENTAQNLKKEIQDNYHWFFNIKYLSNSNSKSVQVEELLRQIDKQKKYLEIHATLNEAILQIQKGNYDSQILGNEGALPCIEKIRKVLKIYYDTHVNNSSHKLSDNELLETECLLQKIANLQGIIQKRQGVNAKNDHELMDYFNRALHSFKMVSDWEKEETDERKVNVLSNIAFILYGWIGDFQIAIQLLDDAYKLNSYNPCVLLHHALCSREIALAKKNNMLSSNVEKTLITNTRTWKGLNKSYKEYIKEAEFFSNSAVQVAPKNYLVRQVNIQVILTENPKENAMKAFKELETAEEYLKENILEISGGFNEYYYYDKAKIFAALGKREEALQNLLRTKIYLQKSLQTAPTNEKDVNPYNYMMEILDFVISDMRQPTSLTALPKCLEIDIDGPVIEIKKPITVNPFRYALKFKPSHSITSMKSETGQKEKAKKDVNSNEQINKRINDLFEGMKEATSANFVSNKYYTVNHY